MKMIATIATALSLTTCAPAFAQVYYENTKVVCSPQGVIEESLKESYGEDIVSVGIAGKNDNLLMTTWANMETGTWTIVVTTPGVKSCAVSSGVDYEFQGLARQPVGEPL